MDLTGRKCQFEEFMNFDLVWLCKELSLFKRENEGLEDMTKVEYFQCVGIAPRAFCYECGYRANGHVAPK